MDTPRALLLALTVPFLGCCDGGSTPDTASQEQRPPVVDEATAATSATTEDDEPLFGVETRDHELHFHADGRYTVYARGGDVLAEGIDRATLERDYPALHELLREDRPLFGFGAD